MESDEANIGKKHHQTKFFYIILYNKKYLYSLRIQIIFCPSIPLLVIYRLLSHTHSLFSLTHIYTDYGPMKKNITQYSSFSNGNGSRLIFYVFCISICTKVCMKEQHASSIGKYM